MSWQTEIISIVRILINDIDTGSPTYSDSRIIQAAAVSAKYVQLDVNLDNTYTVSVTDSEITPDPTEKNDNIFISLLCLKTACLFDQSALRTKAATEGIRAALGPASISVTGNLTGLKMILESGPCVAYSQLSQNINIGDASAIRAILSPFVGNNFDPESLPYSKDRDRNLYS